MATLAPVLQAPKYDLDAVAAFVVFDGLAAPLPGEDAGPYLSVFRRISESIWIIARVG